MADPKASGSGSGPAALKIRSTPAPYIAEPVSHGAGALGAILDGVLQGLPRAPARALRGRDIQFGWVAEPGSAEDEERTVQARPSELLESGDVVFREITSSRSGGPALALVRTQDLPAVAGQGVVAVRPKSGTSGPVLSFVLQYVASPGALELADGVSLGGGMRLSRAMAMAVPVPDAPMLFALEGLTHARDATAAWGPRPRVC